MAAISSSPPPSLNPPGTPIRRDMNPASSLTNLSPVSRKPVPSSAAMASAAPVILAEDFSAQQSSFVGDSAQSFADMFSSPADEPSFASSLGMGVIRAAAAAAAARDSPSPSGSANFGVDSGMMASSYAPTATTAATATTTATDTVEANTSSDSDRDIHTNTISITTTDGVTASAEQDQDQDRDHEDYHHHHPPRRQDADRNSRESDDTGSTSLQPGSVQSSANTSASSLSGTQDMCGEDGDSSGSSVIESPQPIPQFQYHHQVDLPPRVSSVPSDGVRTLSNQQEVTDGSGNPHQRHLTPSGHHVRKNSLPRPQSAYSSVSDSQRGRSPGLMAGGGSAIREHSMNARKSPDPRPSSYAELLNVPYPQPAPAPLSLDNSLLRNAVGNAASLLSAQKTLEMYRQNVKKTNDFSVQYSFAVFLISVAQEQGLDFAGDEAAAGYKGGRMETSSSLSSSSAAAAAAASSYDLVREARGILQKLASGGYPFAQYYLADGFASGTFNKGKEDYNSAFPLFVLAAKHGHAESAYRAALCYEFGWGCRKDPAKAVQYLRTAASKRHPGAMTRLGKACLSGDLGEKRYREGLKWLKLATEASDAQYNAAPYQLGCLYETGYGDDVFRDLSYAAELYTQAADLGHPEANFRMGDAYEHGYLNCPRDPALSVHFYTGAAERGHAGAMMGLCAWYMVGAPPLLDKDEEEAYEWAHRSADLGYVKAQYAIGYFLEMGIGCRRDPLEANVWYVKAADSGDERAKQRLSAIQAAITGQGVAMDVAPPRKLTKGSTSKDDSCVVM